MKNFINSRFFVTVDVRDCQVIQINFPNDGYLDDDIFLMQILVMMGVQVLMVKMEELIKFK